MILGLDISSVTIGWCLLSDESDPPIVADYGEIPLTAKDINKRCESAYWLIGVLLTNLLNRPDGIDLVGIEAPGGSFAGTVIPQCFVSGAVRATITKHGLQIKDISAATAKKKLTNNGKASKADMQCAAEEYSVGGEHASDALAVALACVHGYRKELV